MAAAPTLRMAGLLIPALSVFFSAGCSSPAPQRYTYQYIPGKTASLQAGFAQAPRRAPKEVQRIISAGNRLQGRPYRHGGGHARIEDQGYDCSGTVSYVLYNAGLLDSPMPSSGFRRYGKKGAGKWVTIYQRDGHVFLVVAGLRLDTGGQAGRTGPRWKPEPRSLKGFHARHPPGL
ncbi:MAG TPA: peptidoglycan endopeptidase [Verrucomicrobiales bacterium]|nr:peptidoglycan endopeptidase [Verrucomicrobiales bacterium]